MLTARAQLVTNAAARAARSAATPPVQCQGAAACAQVTGLSQRDLEMPGYEIALRPGPNGLEAVAVPQDPGLPEVRAQAEEPANRSLPGQAASPQSPGFSLDTPQGHR